MYKILIIDGRGCLLFLFAFLLICSFAKSQTLFETAKDDGIISFGKETFSQIKLNLTSSTITYGYYYQGGHSWSKRRPLISGEVKAKPNDDGIATLVEEGTFQPGFQGNLSFGCRFNDVLFPDYWSVLDVYVKGEYKYNAYSIFDSTKMINALEPFYKTSRSTYSVNLLMNIGASFGKTNAYGGFQAGINKTNNADDLAEGKVEALQNYSSASNHYLVSDVEDVKIGQLKNITRYPLKFDLVFDPGLVLNTKEKTNIRLGFLGYYRSNINDPTPKKRVGFGLCFIDDKNPSKIFTSLGYELPMFGHGVTQAEKLKDKGIVFASIGYTIF